MEVELRHKSIRIRAKAARRASHEARDRARTLASRSAELRLDREWLRELHRRSTKSRLEWETRCADEGALPWSLIGGFVESDARRLGRHPVIEEAKTLLCDTYGISRDDAFAILRGASTHSNRKLRDVARCLVESSPG